MSVIHKLAIASAILVSGFMTSPAPSFAAGYRLVYVMSDNLGDKGFNDSAAAGFHRAREGGR